jgi:hypothetical protein
MMARASQHKIRAKSECKIKAGGNKPASFFAYLLIYLPDQKPAENLSLKYNKNHC